MSRHEAARAAGLFYRTRLSYNLAVTDRLCAAIRANHGRIDGAADPLPMGDGIIIEHIDAIKGAGPFRAKIGDCFTLFPTFEEALAFAVEVRAELAEIAA